jgi:hypothetical protein
LLLLLWIKGRCLFTSSQIPIIQRVGECSFEKGRKRPQPTNFSYISSSLYPKPSFISGFIDADWCGGITWSQSASCEKIRSRQPRRKLLHRVCLHPTPQGTGQSRIEYVFFRPSRICRRTFPCSFFLWPIDGRP